MTPLICPDCKSVLASRHEGYFCGHCHREYPLRKGIVSFNETEHYYGELSQEEMREFLSLAEARGWGYAVSDYLPEVNPALIRTITDPRRTSWVSLLNLNGRETALDYGCGLGGVSVPLAARVGEVVALDGCFDRIRFLQVRRDQEGLDNIHLVCSGRAHKLPFADASFDLVVLNMVFPYLAATLPGHDPAAAEGIVLDEIVRTLKVGGQLYLSVRNKYSFYRLKKTIFPFGEEGADNFNLRGYGYYCRLLSRAGLGDLRSFWPIPNYKYPEHLVSLDGRRESVLEELQRTGAYSVFKKAVATFAPNSGALRAMAETMSFVARRL